MEAMRVETQRILELQRSRESSVVNSTNNGVGSLPGVQGTPGRVSLRDVEASLPKFKGDDPSWPVHEWTRAMENKIQAFRWSPLEGYLAAAGALEGAAKRWTDSRTDINAWDTFKVAIEEEFKARTTKAEIYEVMAARKRKREESPADYYQEMKALGRQAGMEEKDVIRYTIAGITDDNAAKMMLYSAGNFSELREKLELLGKALTTPGGGKNANHGNNNKSKKVEGPAKGQGKEKENKCYNCGVVGHRAAACPDKDKGAKCFKCKKFGHIAPACPEAGSSA